MNLSSLSEAKLSIAVAGGALVVVGAARLLLGASAAPWDTGVEVVVVGSLLGAAAWLVRRADLTIREVSAVCKRARHGDLEGRILGARERGGLGEIQAAVNDMLDIIDAYVRKSSASMEYVSHGKCFRKVLVRGLPGSFRRGATIINAGTDAMDRKVGDLARVAQTFGASMDNVAKTLAVAATDLGSDADQMAAAAEETSRQSTGVAAASEQASTNVQTVASAAEQLSASIAEISRQVSRSSSSTESGRRRGKSNKRPDQEPGRSGPADRRCSKTHHRCRRTDQPARTKCHDRGGTRRRSGPGLCRGGVGGKEPCQSDSKGDRGNQHQDCRNAGDHRAVGRGGASHRPDDR